MQITLPWPPSTNHYWIAARGRVILTAEARAYHYAILRVVGPFLRAPEGRLRVELHAYPPDHRKRDLDNLQKVLLDSLTRAKFWIDDALIDDLRIVRREQIKDGQIILSVEVI